MSQPRKTPATMRQQPPPPESPPHEPHQADTHARRLGHHGVGHGRDHHKEAKKFGEPHHDGHPSRHAVRRTGSPPRKHAHHSARRRVGQSLSSIESTDVSSESDSSSDISVRTEISSLSDSDEATARGDADRKKRKRPKKSEPVKPDGERDRPVDFLFGGIKKSFRGEKDGSVIAPHTVIQLAAIFAAECLGTMMLLFIGCLGLVFGPGHYSRENAHLEASTIFGLTVMFIIQIIGHTSACHINPAVSLCALLLGKLRVVSFLVYVVAQLIGALLGVGLLKGVVAQSAWNSTGPGLGCCISCVTIPHKSLNNAQAFMAEFVVTAILIFTVCSVWDKRNGIDPAAPLKFGLTIACLALAEGHLTGCSMNPARSFGPAVWEGKYERHWVYWVAPMTASLFATLSYTFVFERDYWTFEPPEDVALSDIKSGREPEPDE